MNQVNHQTQSCPNCEKVHRFPASLAQVRCKACGFVWNAKSVVSLPDQSVGGKDPQTHSGSTNLPIMIGSLVIAVILMLAIGSMLLLSVFTIGSVESQPVKTAIIDTPEKPAFKFPEYQVIRLQESDRKKLYSAYRGVARTTVEKPLPLPQGSPPRKALEVMLQQTLDRELMRLAALYNISIDDVNEVIKEGNANYWDPTPRSNATRNGKRIYPEEMSEGWTKSNNLR